MVKWGNGRDSKTTNAQLLIDGISAITIKIRSEPFIPGAIELDVQTVCNYDGIIIKVFSPVHISGEVFPRNAHENCSIAINGTEAQLKMLFSSQSCSISRNGFVFENVIVVKQNNLSEMPVITEYDKLYRISCDYSNQTTQMSATSVLQVKNMGEVSIHPQGKIPYNPIKMELRSKRKSEVKTVILGQNVDLRIDDDDNFGSNYTVTSCIARDRNERESLTIIEDGCATRSASEYIVRGAVRRESKGFSIPLRAFRFRESDSVKISCRLEVCDDMCEPKDCSKHARRRRYLSTDKLGIDSDHGDEVQISLLVRNEAMPPSQLPFFREAEQRTKAECFDVVNSTGNVVALESPTALHVPASSQCHQWDH
ncbi:zona pellucida-like domain protein [Teladorsagia circumcincta]|uniref:Zona pellucida-like domain protein n=1 Tax=Teladorsagia circumcincta TaxID=45464 RepID=A0A2G9U2D1_TELCI|nr:zona pellucida-like domain protein [Teladorsagia circumcincta]